MRIIIQRVCNASVTIEGQLHSAIGQGMMILVGIEDADGDDDIAFLVKKVTAMRIFDDENGVMNLSVKDVGGSVLLVNLSRFVGNVAGTASVTALSISPGVFAASARA